MVPKYLLIHFNYVRMWNVRGIEMVVLRKNSTHLLHISLNHLKFCEFSGCYQAIQQFIFLLLSFRTVVYWLLYQRWNLGIKLAWLGLVLHSCTSNRLQSGASLLNTRGQFYIGHIAEFFVVVGFMFAVLFWVFFSRLIWFIQA